MYSSGHCLLCRCHFERDTVALPDVDLSVKYVLLNFDDPSTILIESFSRIFIPLVPSTPSFHDPVILRNLEYLYSYDRAHIISTAEQSLLDFRRRHVCLPAVIRRSCGNKDPLPRSCSQENSSTCFLWPRSCRRCSNENTPLPELPCRSLSCPRSHRRSCWSLAALRCILRKPGSEWCCIH